MLAQFVADRPKLAVFDLLPKYSVTVNNPETFQPRLTTISVFHHNVWNTDLGVFRNLRGS